MKASKEDGAVIAHATDSTTRKTVGSFSVSGIHINKDKVIPLPTLNTSSESTDNIADGVIVGMNMIATASNQSGKL